MYNDYVKTIDQLKKNTPGMEKTLDRLVSDTSKQIVSDIKSAGDMILANPDMDSYNTFVQNAEQIKSQIPTLAKEIDINAPDEALKAQAVCIYTFLKHAREQKDASDYDITDNPAHHQAFLTRGQLHTFWGENYEANYQKLQKIVAAVKGQYMSYKGQTVLAAYHSSNAGRTESASVYWGENYPYLQPVTSIGDTLCPAYMTKVVFSPEEFKSALSKAKDKTFHFPESPSDWLGEINTSPSGTVTDVTLADVTLTGREMRDLLSLKSSFFTLRYVGGNFLLKVSGYGHGVGLSQEGAKYMASLGFSYKDILCHYYNGVEIKEENAV